MNFRMRLFTAFLMAVLLPMVVLALVIRGEMTQRLTSQYNARVNSLIEGIETDLEKESVRIDEAVSVFKQATLQDNRFRRAAVDQSRDERAYLLDYAGGAMRLTGLTMLQIQDESGRIVSSGHFRNEYDRLDRQLPLLLREVSGHTALFAMRAPDAAFFALTRVDSIRMGERRFTIVAGTRVGRGMLAQLSRGKELAVSLIYPGGIIDAAMEKPAAGEREKTGEVIADDRRGAVAGKLDIPFINLERDGIAEAAFYVTHDLAGLRALRSSIDRWFVITTAAAILLVVLLVGWLSSRINRPIADLAEKTSRIDFDRLDVDFDSHRTDEIGVLSQGLAKMTERLRASALLIREAERRAAVGDLARQVNHDIKNGLTPIRNIVHHLLRLTRESPGDLPKVLEERQQTLDGGIAYLEQLATHYARLSPKREHRICDVNEILRRIVADLRGSTRIRMHLDLSEEMFVMGDHVSLRRIFENLITNAIESFDEQLGTISITTRLHAEENCVRVTIIDTGAGMSEEQRSKIFNDFYTTKEQGTGLGLSIVRRLVMDLDGYIRVESEAGVGSRFMVDLPVAHRAGEAGLMNEKGHRDGTGFDRR